MNMSDEQVASMIEEYKNGELATVLAKKYGVNVRTIGRKLTAAGVEKQSRSYVARKTFGGELDEHAFDVLTPEVEYWLGFLFADGNVSKNQIQINLGRKDREHLEKFKVFMKSSTNIYDGVMPATARTRETEYSKFIVSSEMLRKKLFEYGLTERKSMTADPAKCLLDSVDFWRGVVDGDGNVSVQFHKEQVYRGYTYAARHEASVSLVGSKKVVEGFKTFVEARLPEVKNSISLRSNLHEYRVQGAKAVKLAALLYDNPVVFLDRKYAASKEIQTTVLGAPRPKHYVKRK